MNVHHALGRIHLRLLLLFSVLMIAVAGCGENVYRDPAAEEGRDQLDNRQQIVTLEIDYGEVGGTPGTGTAGIAPTKVDELADLRQINVEYAPGMTVLQAMLAARDRQELDFIHASSGETAFLDAIDGLANEGAGGSNWTYQVNGEPAHKSFGAYRLEAGDRVTWRFGSGVKF